MHNGDVLGDEGRKALNACVKVKIYGKPETRRYDWETAVKRLWGCYGGQQRLFAASFYGSYGCHWKHVQELLLPTEFDRQGDPLKNSTYNIFDIRDALVRFDERRCVEKYPKEEPGSDKLRCLIDKRRADVEREYKAAVADPDGRLRYSWVVAQRRVRDCFVGNFLEDRFTLLYSLRNEMMKKSYNIIDIYNTFVHWDEERKTADEKRDAIVKEYEAAANADAKHTLPKYSSQAATKRLCDCSYDYPHKLADDFFPHKVDASGNYDIFDIHKALLQFGGKKLLQKYPEQGPGSDELKKLIDEHREDLKEEYQKAKNHVPFCHYDHENPHQYSLSEAERRVRDCFAGTFMWDTEIFSKKEKDESDQTYDIFDIKKAIDHFDTKTFLDACKYPSEQEPGYAKEREEVDKERARIQKEYEEATCNVEIEHGSGFIVHDHFIITNKHVIETYLNETESHEIYISNAAINDDDDDDDLSCTVAHHDVGKDLALLYCPNLNLEQCDICPLQLSNQSLLPGMSVFTFGYPISHTEETALFVSGNVSGSKRTLAGHSMVVLNCSLNSGNSGGPVLRWINGQLKVVGVATQKHIKEILTFEERETIEKIKKSLQTRAISDVSDFAINCLSSSAASFSLCDIPISILTLKLYEALETHCQFNLSNALPGKLVIEFIETSIGKYAGEHKKELAEVIKLANETVDTLQPVHTVASNEQ